MPHPLPASCSISFLPDDCSVLPPGFPASILVTLWSSLSTAATVNLLNVNQGVLFLGPKPFSLFQSKIQSSYKDFEGLIQVDTHQCSKFASFHSVPLAPFPSRAEPLVIPLIHKDTPTPGISSLSPKYNVLHTKVLTRYAKIQLSQNFSFNYFYQGRVDLQCWVNFCCTA